MEFIMKNWKFIRILLTNTTISGASNAKPDLIYHNGYYGNLIYFIQVKCLRNTIIHPDHLTPILNNIL